MLEISITSDTAHFSQEHKLFGRSYILEFEWVEREEYWVLHLYDGSKQPITLGLRISLSWPIWFDRANNLALLLVAKHPQAVLGLKTLHKDFALVAHREAL